MKAKELVEMAAPSSAQRPPFDQDRLTRDQAAAYVGLSPDTLATDVSRKSLKIPYYKVGAKPFYRRSDLDCWLETRRIESELR